MPGKSNYFVAEDKVNVRADVPTFGGMAGTVIRRSPYTSDVAIVQVDGYTHGLAFTDHELMHRRENNDVATDGTNPPR